MPGLPGWTNEHHMDHVSVTDIPGPWRVDALCVGRCQPLGPRGVPSGIRKAAVTQRISLTATGFAGDEQGDRRHHGGPDKAIHHYPREHHAAWAADIGPHPLLQQAGAFGENLSTTGLQEADVAIGDRFALSDAIVEVSQGRQPCFRLNLRFGLPGMARAMQHSGRTGWYYRVIQEGMVASGDRLRLLDRPTPAWTVARLHRILHLDPLDRDELRGMAALAALPERWRLLAEHRLGSGMVEDWRGRLEGP